MKKAFRYIEHIWLGTDNKPSLKAVLAIAFSVNFMYNLSHAIYKWDAGHSMEGLSLVLGIEAGLILGMLGITAMANVAAQKIESQAVNPPSSSINIARVGTVSTGTTKANVVNAEQVDTVNSQQTNISKQQIDNPDA